MQDAPKKRRKRPPLSPEGIETAALALINREGLAGFSMRKLGAELGCEAMSLYHYFPSTGHLMDALIDRIARQYLPMPAGSLPWRERLRAFCIRWRAVALANPGFFGFLATHRMNTPTALRAIDGVIALIREGTASDEEAARLFRALGYYLMGAGLDETAGYSRGPSTVAPVPAAEMARDYPAVTAAAPWFAPAAREATFLMGLDAFLDGWLGARGQPGV